MLRSVTRATRPTAEPAHPWWRGYAHVRTCAHFIAIMEPSLHDRNRSVAEVADRSNLRHCHSANTSSGNLADFAVASTQKTAVASCVLTRHGIAQHLLAGGRWQPRDRSGVRQAGTFMNHQADVKRYARTNEPKLSREPVTLHRHPDRRAQYGSSAHSQVKALCPGWRLPGACSWSSP